LTEFSAHVIDTEDSGKRVYLDQTAFYPTSGGQPHDSGMLAGKEIVDIVDEDDRVCHVLAEPFDMSQVNGCIDWGRRYDHMQQHTGQHLLSAVLLVLFGYETVSFHMGEEVSSIELAVKDLTDAQIDEAEKLANERIREARPVTIHFEEATSELGLRKASKRSGTLRVIDIQGVDRSACGGTHVRSTAEIGMLQIRKLERVRGNVRLEFVCGTRALGRTKQDFRILQELARQAATTIDRLPEHAAGLRIRLADSEKANEKLTAELARREGSELYQSTIPGLDGLRRTLVQVTTLDTATRAKAQAFVAGTRAVFAAVGCEPASVLIASSPDSGVNAGAVMKRILSAAGGRGGGSNVLAQGSVPKITGELLQELTNLSG
jgi:alanyl-tRNA synthetase